VSVLNTVSFGLAGWQTATSAQFDAGIASLMFRQQLWGYPVGLFIHVPDLTGPQVWGLVASLKNHGSTVMLNTDLRDWIVSGLPVPGGTPAGSYYAFPTIGAADFTRLATSPDVGRGIAIAPIGSTTFDYDLNGAHRTGNWDIGAYQLTGSKLTGAKLAGAKLN
jgi:hypothetical protein